jgi:hypothetical protein
VGLAHLEKCCYCLPSRRQVLARVIIEQKTRYAFGSNWPTNHCSKFVDRRGKRTLGETGCSSHGDGGMAAKGHSRTGTIKVEEVTSPRVNSCFDVLDCKRLA